MSHLVRFRTWGRLLSWVAILLGMGSDLVAAAAARARARDLLQRGTAWYSSAEALRFASNVISFQSEYGGWPKNTDTFSEPYLGSDRRNDLKPTFDNGATLGELRFLARVYRQTGTAVFKESFEKGVNYILDAQYPNGGWPQAFPPRGGSYERFITFNDDAMTGVMRFLRETAISPEYSFVPPAQKHAAQAAFDKGITCILKCQVRVGGKLTAWCAQHDDKDFTPRRARTYELPSLSGAESVGVVRLLMSLPKPDKPVVRSIEAAVAWFDSAKLKGIRVVKVPDPASPKGTDKRVENDPVAPPMWARFYDLRSGLPIFCDRDGVPKHKLSEIGYERRNGYNWLDYWPRDLLEKEYPAWRKTHARALEQK